MKKLQAILLIPMLVLSLCIGGNAYAQNTLQLGSFTPEVSTIDIPTLPNAVCTNAWAEKQINDFKKRGSFDNFESKNKSLIACEIYKYITGCRTNDVSCTSPCTDIRYGPSKEQIQNDPRVRTQLDALYAISGSLFPKYWLYTKGTGRFSLRNGFDLNAAGLEEAKATLAAMTCAERSEEINHHIDTPLYFYPQKEATLDVTVPAGTYTIKASKNGQFEYGGKMYTSLAYKLETELYDKPQKGRIINGKNLKSELRKITKELELTNQEADDFIAYWTKILPKANWFQASLFEDRTARKLANWRVVPKPDTEIRYIFYFKPLIENTNYSTSYTYKPQKRIGFTVLDWGGVIDW